MILSEFAGAAQSLNGSLLINPCMSRDSLVHAIVIEADPVFPLFLGDVQSTADAIYQALTLFPQQRKSNWQKLFNYVSKYTAEAWGVSFVNERASMFSLFVFILSRLHRPVQSANSACFLSFLVNRLSGQRPSGPAGLAGRRKSGSLSRRSSKASIQRRKSSQSGGIVTGLGAAAGAAVNWAQSQVQGGSQA